MTDRDLYHRPGEDVEPSDASKLSAQDEELLRQARTEMRLDPGTTHITCPDHGCTAPVLDVYRSMNWVFDDNQNVTCDPFYPTCFEADERTDE